MNHSVPNRNWSYPTAIKFGLGRISELAEHCKAAGVKQPLFVTDKALASLPITAQALDGLAAPVWDARCSPRSIRTRTRPTWRPASRSTLRVGMTE